VIAGHDRAALGALVFPSPAGRALPAPALAAQLAAAVAAYNAAHPATSERIARALVVPEPLSLDDGETTDKGYTNQRRVLERRAAAVDALFAEPPGPDVLAL
jgi:feruloyl-CoA synthase